MVDDRTLIEASERNHRRIQWVLRIGLLLGVVTMASGLAIDLVEGDMAAVAVPLRSITRAGSVGDRVMAVGILMLILTPVARVVALIGIWGRQRDRKFALVGTVVLVVLCLGIVLGRG